MRVCVCKPISILLVDISFSECVINKTYNGYSEGDYTINLFHTSNLINRCAVISFLPI